MRSPRRRTVVETRWMSGMMRGGATRRDEGRGRERWGMKYNNAVEDLMERKRKSIREKSREGRESLKREVRAGRKKYEDFGEEEKGIIRIHVFLKCQCASSRSDR
ncbi:hypothetical protein PoB_003141400 [Plakobranchus ocellatus]|uniref:Uncharacterized protein n=1 Tax=Plakobranchus ocellatus TaxID=259542 RepID=A0AAV4AB98_9GAST|nr:hypothetical protein PoB_003141400 [Plakobranchus ocellatus]